MRPSCAALRVTPLLAFLTMCRFAIADPIVAPGPPPDTSSGEHSDGKVSVAPRYDELLMLPRMLLAPPRLLIRGLGVPIHALTDLDAKYHILSFLSHILTSEDGTRGLRPVFRYISRFEPQLGVTYFDTKSLGTGSSIALTFGAVLPALVFGEARIQPRLPEPYKLVFNANYLDRNDMLFAGVGPASDGGLRVSHALLSHVAIKQWNAAATLTVKLHKYLRVHAGPDWSLRRYGNGEYDDERKPIAIDYCQLSVGGCLTPRVDPKLVPGYYQGADYFAMDAGLAFDTRGGGTYSSGYWLRFTLDARYAQSPHLHGPNWFREHASLTGGIPLGGHTRELILRVSADLLEPIARETVPFSELVVLGGPDDFRGAPIGRFHDYSALLATLEYRWAIWMWMDAVVFTDWVGVFGQHFKGFTLDKFVPDIGAGLTVHSTNRFTMRVQVAYGIGSGVQTMFATTTGF